MKGLRRSRKSHAYRTKCGIWPNWPDLWRDYDCGICCCHVLWGVCDQIDLIYEGITTPVGWIVMVCVLSTKLTWFMKGLRPKCGRCYCHLLCNGDQIDLIYEGITTANVVNTWQLSSTTKLTWFMKGLRQLELLAPILRFSTMTKLTWFMKGLRHTAQSAVYTIATCWPNWPDLWRDYDDTWFTPYYCGLAWWPNWPDLWRDYDYGADAPRMAVLINKTKLTWFMKGLRLISRVLRINSTASETKLTWFMKGLRLPQLIAAFKAAYFVTKLTWFMKGLRPRQGKPLWCALCPWPNWPDLWRDYDPQIWLLLVAAHWRPNWPDLWRDYDPKNSINSISPFIETKLTWFMKGLRLHNFAPSIVAGLSYDQIDLIYEGITTYFAN